MSVRNCCLNAVLCLTRVVLYVGLCQLPVSQEKIFKVNFFALTEKASFLLLKKLPFLFYVRFTTAFALSIK